MKKEKKFVVLETVQVAGGHYETRLMRLEGHGRWATADEAKRQAEYKKSRVKHSGEYHYEVAKILTFREVAS